MRIRLQNYGVGTPFASTYGIMSQIVQIRPVTIYTKIFRKNLNNNELQWPPIPQGIETTQNQNLSDTLTLADTIVQNIGWNKTDSLTLSDFLAKVFGLSKSDSIALSDAISNNVGLSKSDALTLSDLILENFGLNKTDILSLTDSLVKIVGLNKIDASTLSDALAKTIGLNRTDTLTLSDSVAQALGLSKSDSLILSDIISKVFAFNESDNLTLSDAISNNVSLSKSDLLILSDIINYLSPLTLSLSDTVTLTDTIIKTIGPGVGPGVGVSPPSYAVTIITVTKSVGLAFTETDSIGAGYPDSTPILVPIDEVGSVNENGTVCVVNTTPKVYEGILPRRNTPSGPSEQGGKVMFDLVNGRYIPRIQFTPSAIQ